MVRLVSSFSISKPFESNCTNLKLEEGRKEFGLIKEVIFMTITVEAGKALDEMLFNSKYWTELSVKEVTRQLCSGITVEFVKVIEKTAERLDPIDTYEGRPNNHKKSTNSDFCIWQKFSPDSIRDCVCCILSDTRYQACNRCNSNRSSGHCYGLR